MKKALSIILVFCMLMTVVPTGLFPVHAATVTDDGNTVVTSGDDWQMVTAPVSYAANDDTAAVSDVSTADGSISMITTSLLNTKKFRFALMCDDAYKDMVDAFAATIEKNTGVAPSYGYASYTQTYELIIGNCSSRSASATIDNEVKSARADNANDYIIRLVDTKIYIVGATDYALQNALDCFIELFVQDADGSIPAEYNYYHKPAHVTYTLAGNSVADYTIRTERYPSQIVQLAAQTVQKAIIDRCGYILPIKAMNLEGTDAGDKEIRVGPMNGAVNVERVYDTRFTSDDWQNYYTSFETDGMLDADYGYYRIGFDGNNLEIEGGSAYAINVGVVKVLADLASKKNLASTYTQSGTYESGFDYKKGSGYDAVDFSMTGGFGLVYAEEFDYEGTDEQKEKAVKSKWAISKDETPDDVMYQYRPGVYGNNWWVSADTSGNNYLFEVTKKRVQALGDPDDNGYDSGRLVSASKWGFRYGIWETRIVMGTRNGACSAVWSNTASPYSTAVPNHEIDVYENYGRDVFVPCLHAFYPGENSSNYLYGKPYLQSPCWLEPNEGEHYYDTFHHMSVDWTYDYIKIYFDGELASEMALDDDHPKADCYRNGQTIKLANGVGKVGYCKTTPPQGLPTSTGTAENGFIPSYWMEDITKFFEVQVVDYTRVYQTSNDNISYAPAQNDIRFTPSFDNLSAQDEEDDGEEERPEVVVADPQSFESYAVGDELSISNYKATVTDAEAHTGEQSLLMSCGNKTAALRPQVMLTDVSNQQVTVEQGKDYKVSFWIKVPEGSICEKLHYWFTATNSDTAYSSGGTKDAEKIYEVNSHYIQQGEWQKIEFTIEDCAYSGNVRMGITGDYTGSYFFYMDDVLVDPVVLDPTAPHSFESYSVDQELDLNTTSKASITVTDEIAAYSGEKVAKVGSSDGSGNKRPQMMVKNGANQPVYVYKGRNYEFSYYIYIPEGSENYQINYWLAATEDEVCFDGSTYKKDDYVIAEKTGAAQPTQGQWKKITLTITDCAHSGQLRLGITSDGSVWREFYIDDLLLVEQKGEPRDEVQSYESDDVSEKLSLGSGEATIVVTDEDSRSGEKSAKVMASGNDISAPPQMLLTNVDGTPVEVEQGKHYYVQFWVAAANEATDYDIQYWLAVSQDDTPFSSGNPRTGVLCDTTTVTVEDKGEWHCVTVLISNCAVSGKLRLGICGTADVAHTMFIDDVLVEERVSVDVDPNAMNFENYEIDDKTLCLNSTGTNKLITVTNEQYYTGSRGIKITSNDASGNKRPQFDAIDSNGNYLTVQQGENYTISFMVYIPEGHTYGTLSYWMAAIPEEKAGVAFGADETDAEFIKDNYVIYEVTASSLPSVGKWYKVDIPIVSCAHSGILRVGITHGDTNITGYLYVDDIKVEEPKSVNVKFVTNGADNTIADVTAIVGALLPYRDIKPVRDGYVFMGWYTSPDFSSDSYFNIYGDVVPSRYGDTLTLYACWKDEDHVYSSVCDTVCDDCGYTRIAPATHTYDDDCDASCNVCQTERDAYHAYRADCATVCTVCGDVRTALIEHTHTNACDADCNVCGEVRAVGDHVYDNACDTDCNECGDIRTVGDHVYDNACDTDCNECGDVRTVGDHVYDNACDTDCNECGDIRTVGDHVYDNACDTDCNECGDIRAVGDHVYDNACDTDCNECGDIRTVGDHVYDNVCDADCNECGDIRAVGDHVYDNACDTDCNECGDVRPIEHTYAGACDAKCDICGHIRDTDSAHTYTDIRDTDCDVCGATRTLTAVTVSKLPDTLSYLLNAALDTTGMELTLTYDDGASGVITDGYAVSGFDSSAAGECVVTVTYGGKTTTFTVTVIEYVAGDVSGDGELNNKDLSVFMRYLNGWDETVDERALDVNADGKINNKDYVILMRYLNGWDVVLT